MLRVAGSGNQRSLTHAYLASVSFVDHCVGIVLGALKESPHADQHHHCFVGESWFSPRRETALGQAHPVGKSTRVPLLISGPGIKPGKECKEPASLLDLLVDLCNLPKNDRRRHFLVLNSKIRARPESILPLPPHILAIIRFGPVTGD